METWVAILIGAVGTWFIAFFAIADRLKSWWIKPQLRVEPGGVSSSVVKHGIVNVRYYFVRVTNPTRIPPAHEAQLVLTRIEKSGASGPETKFDEIMPLGWVRQELYRSLTRTIGSYWDASLFFVQSDGILIFTPARSGELAWPHFPGEHKGPTTLWVTLHARSIEADSPSVRLKIEWDGRWYEGKAEMERGCKVSLIRAHKTPKQKLWRPHQPPSAPLNRLLIAVARRCPLSWFASHSSAVARQDHVRTVRQPRERARRRQAGRFHGFREDHGIAVWENVCGPASQTGG